MVGIEIDTLKEKRIIVTGGTGNLGSRLIQRLQDLGIETLAISRSSETPVDITKWGDVRNIPKGDILYHLAAVVGVPFSYQYPLKTYETNIFGTLNILEYCRKNDVERIIYASSYIYGEPKYLPIDEKHPVNPTNPYMRSKYMGELLCEAYYEDYNISCTVLRIFNLYGGDQSKDFLIPEIADQMFKSGSVVLNDLKPKRDFVFIDDVVDALLSSVNAPKGFEIFNIGSGKSISVGEVAEIMVRVYKELKEGKKIAVRCKKLRRKREITDTVADIRKAKEILNWVPKISIDEGLRKVVEGKTK